MKLRISLFFQLLIILCSARAQNNTLEIGVATGLNISSLHNDSYHNYFDWRYSTVMSVQTNYSLSQNLSVVSGITYESKGCKGKNMKLLGVERTSLGSHHTFDYALEYVTIPVLVRYTGTRFPFFVNAGPYIGQLLSYTETYDIITLNRFADVKKDDYGLCLGAGATISLSDDWNISVEVRENLGLSNVKNTDETYKTSEVRPVNDLNPMYNNAINLFVGVHYSL